MNLVIAKLFATLAVSALAVGASAPETATAIKMKSAVDGKSVAIADVRGKAGTLVIFDLQPLPVPRGWEHRIADLANGYSKKGIGVIRSTPHDPAKYPEDDFAGMQARAKQLGLQVPYVVDETSGVARALGASVTPEAFLFDKTGKLGLPRRHRRQPPRRGRREGPLSEGRAGRRARGRPAPLAETKGIGCGIKFR